MRHSRDATWRNPTRRILLTRSCGNVQQSWGTKGTCEGPGTLTCGKEAREEQRRRRRNFFASLCAKDENDAKTTAADLTREATAAHGIRERNERYATIKPECRGVPRPRETLKFSSIFLSQEGRVGAEDAFAIPTVLWCRAALNDRLIKKIYGTIFEWGPHSEIVYYLTIEMWTRGGGINHSAFN